MRKPKSTAWSIVACLTICATGSAQQLITPSTANHELTTRRAASEEPRPFSPRAAIEARPLPSASEVAQQNPAARPRLPQPAMNFRLVSAEESVVNDSDQQGRAPLRLAPRSAESRTAVPGVARPTVPTASTAIGTVAASLAIVLGLFLIIAWCSRRVAGQGTSLLPKEVIEMLGRAPLASRQQVQLVRIGNKLLLVALSAGEASTLTEIDDPAEVEHLTALCRRGKPGSSSAAFQQVLSQLAAEPAAGGFVGSSTARGGR